MKILVLTDEIYPDGVSGLGKTVYNECIALEQRGHSVTVLVRSVDHSLPQNAVISNLNIFRFYGPDRRRFFYRLYPIWILFQVSFWLHRYFKDYDILYLHNPIYILPIRITRACRNIPTVYTFHASIAAEIYISANGGKYGNLKLLAYLAAKSLGVLEKWALNRTDAVLPRSNFTLQVVRQIGCISKVPDTEHLIPLGVNVQAYIPANKLVARAYLNLPQICPILITIRRLDGRMGLTNLIEAIKIVKESYPDILQLIIGKGYMRPILETLVNKNSLASHVRLLGFVSEDELATYLAASDLFILPTETLEGFGLATIEALATGIPVIGTPIGATPEILQQVDSRLLTRNSSPQGLAEALSYWLDHWDQLDGLSKKCRSSAERLYNIDQVAAQLESLFYQVKESKVLSTHVAHVR